MTHRTDLPDVLGQARPMHSLFVSDVFESRDDTTVDRLIAFVEVLRSHYRVLVREEFHDGVTAED